MAEILKFVKGCAQLENNNEPIDAAILTIPALYSEHDARKAVMNAAAKQAGFKEVEFLSEPEAAAYHYTDIAGVTASGKYLIYDLGGGTFDPALLELSGKTARLLGNEAGVKAGGHFFDKAIYTHIAQLAKSQEKLLSRSSRLEDYDACRRLKETLSIMPSAAQIFSNGVKYELTREDFNELIKPTINLTLQACDNLMSTAGVQWSELKQVLLVGGSTAIPLIADILHSHLISHNAPAVKIVRNTKGQKGEYNHRFATCLGGISRKILPPPPPPEKPAVIECCGKRHQLCIGDNKFGRGEDADFRFDDAAMSRHHFTITVTKGADGKLNYMLTTNSQSRATIVNNMEALDLRYVPISRISIPLLDGFTITAGKTNFIFKKIDNR